jgi:hypothetical protein
MQPRTARKLLAIAPVMAALATGGCGVEERDALRVETARLAAEKSRLARRVAELEAESRRDRVLAADERRRAESAEQERRVADEARARDVAAAQAKVEARADEVEHLTAHRDELREWIETDLLPLAEKGDPRLVNLRDAAADMAAEVEKVRGLKFKHPFMRRLIPRTLVGDWMRRDLRKELPQDEARKMVTVGAEFGLLAPDTNVYEMFSEFLEAGAAAFYRPETQTFYHIEGNDGRGARPVVFHELVHALEDQHFDLKSFYEAVQKDADAAMARRAVVEGSASFFASIYEREHPGDVAAMAKSQMTPEMVKKQMKMMQTVPPSLIATIGLYPYKNAPAWLEAIKADEPAEIERLFRDPPVSTEQVLHPEKFPLDGPRDYPRAVAVPDVAHVLGEGWENVDDNGMGELMTGCLVTQLRAKSYAATVIALIDMKTQGLSFKKPVKEAVEGWDGDRYTAWIEKSTGRVTIVWTSAWDSEKDAQEFADTYGAALGKRVLGDRFKSAPEVVRYEDSAGRVSGLDVLPGARVVAVLGAPSAKFDALLAAGAAAAVTPDPRDPNDR